MSAVRASWWRPDPTPTREVEEVDAVGERVRRALDGSRADSAWVEHRFEGPLRTLLRDSYANARTHVIVNMAVIAGGFATSGIAVAAGKAATTAGKTGGHNTLTWVVFAIGLLVALAGGISQIFRPGQRSTGRSLLAAEMLDEGWALHNHHGIYAADLTAEELFVLFDGRIGAIRTRAFQLAVLDDPATKSAGSAPATPSASPSGKGRSGGSSRSAPS